MAGSLHPFADPHTKPSPHFNEKSPFVLLAASVEQKGHSAVAQPSARATSAAAQEISPTLPNASGAPNSPRVCRLELPGAVGVTELTLWHYATFDKKDLVEHLVNEFNAKHSNVHVTAIEMDSFSRILDELRNGTPPPDVMLVGPEPIVNLSGVCRSG